VSGGGGGSSLGIILGTCLFVWGGWVGGFEVEELAMLFLSRKLSAGLSTPNHMFYTYAHATPTIHRQSLIPEHPTPPPTPGSARMRSPGT